MFVKLNNQQPIEISEKSTARDLAEKMNLRGPHQALGVSINGKKYDLSQELSEGDEVEFFSFEDPKGKEIFWHTSAHILAQAVLRLYPEAKPTIGPPIENGFYYDFANLNISENDFEKIEKEMQAIIGENYITQREIFSSKEQALQAFKNNKYKTELINSFDSELTGYQQGEFFDLCRGPHLFNLGKVKAIKLMKTSGAYWKGDPQKEMLTRIYGISFPERKMLKEYLQQIEEAKKRDHKVLGPHLDLFSLKEEAPGMPFIHHKGMIIWNTLLKFIREYLEEGNYIEIKTPTLMARELWELSGHWTNYKQNMFSSSIEDHDYAIKPMNCPGCMLFYKSQVHSYRELPLRVAEIGNVHRYEPSGALSGLFRCRSFHQDDAHIFMKPSDIKQEILSILHMADSLYTTFGLHYHLELSTRPEKNTIGSDEEWEMATKGLKEALDESGYSYKINPGDGAFYGPKIDFHIRDAINRTWQCGTIQLDMALPERFQLEYTAADGSRQRPVMLHRAIFGSVERFFGILIEHFSGKFPLWISPLQLRILTVADRHAPYADEICATLKKKGFHVDVDDASESVSKKIRNAQLAQINYILTVGDQEQENKTINLRTRDNVVHGQIKLDELILQIEQERKSRSLETPFKKETSSSCIV
ncbi:Threonine--tRNA ligase [Neochlamydia sp. AcF65]|uniref:threonine--tRNA ligase n=1 Tax=Neochlamydia sp. AcF65 TaxID=2795735 RepID=UPI001BC96350|nr:threonine--tRNA ligase [Neochlamydia sp. AcF65]MBS4165764.1 Threonine--tRNA ligase [Neochlamydia sp. AcF65]